MTTIWSETALLPSGWASRVRIAMAHGKIAAIETEVPAEVGDERHCIALPGLCNVHSHAFQRGMAGLAEHRGGGEDNFWSWREVMYRFLDHLNPDDVEAICAMAFMEMLETGYTRVGEFHYLHHDVDGQPYRDPAELAGRVVAAARTVGIGLTLLPVFYAHSNFGGQPASHGQRRFINGIDGFSRLQAACRSLLADDDVLGIAPHSLRAVTEDELAALAALQPLGPVHIHVAEQAKEVRDSLAYSGARPVEWLLAHADVDPRWCLVHATHVTESETDAMAASGAVVGLCPVTEANLGDGIFPAARYLGMGGRIATGTDSNVLIDPAQELRALEYSQRLAHQARNVLASDQHRSVARRLFEASLAGGAQALGVEPGLVIGNAADIVTLSAEHPQLQGGHSDRPLDHWVFAARNNCVDAVWRYGRKMVSGGRHRDAAPITARYRKVLERILAA
jgi:formimidoylglutamate deiminase